MAEPLLYGFGKGCDFAKMSCKEYMQTKKTALVLYIINLFYTPCSAKLCSLHLNVIFLVTSVLSTGQTHNFGNLKSYLRNGKWKRHDMQMVYL